MTPFNPSDAATVNIDVASSTAAIQVSSGSGMTQVRVMNNGSATAWIRFGTATLSATTTAGIPIGSGGTEVFTVHAPIWAAAIAAGSTGKIYFTAGQGI